MLKTVVLLCSVSVDHSACTRRTAIDYVPLPAPTVVCGLGDVAAAMPKLSPEPGKSYIVVACEREVAR